MRFLSLLLLAIAVSPAIAQPVPIWSTEESQVAPFVSSYSQAVPALLSNGDAFMVAGEAARSGLAVSLHLTPAGAITRGQFGGRSFVGGTLVAEAVLATQGEWVVLRMTERKNTVGERALVVMIDAAGEVRWLLPRFGHEARFLDNGDVLLSSRNQIMRLRGSDGDLVWVRNLLDLRSEATEAALSLPQEIGPGLILGIDFTERDGSGQEMVRRCGPRCCRIRSRIRDSSRWTMAISEH